MLKVQEIREIIKLIDDSKINEFTYEANGTKIKIKKPDTQSSTHLNQKEIQQISVNDPEPIVQNEVKEPELSVPTTSTEEASAEDHDYEIVSPMVGTFYKSPSPDSEPYVKVGQAVDEETTVCIVEAMKLFNEIEAEINGEIIEILVEDGELVEYGQPLFKVKTT